MGKSDLSSITSFECRSLLDSIQNEYEQRQKEDGILSKVQEDLAEIIAQRNILAKRENFNDKYCILCCSTFNLLFKRKVCCQDCHFWVCRSCSLWDNFSKQWLCSVCEKQRVLDAESRLWMYNRIKEYFRNFGSAKALQNFCRLKKLADVENDSGYGTTNDFMPLMKLLSSNSLNKDLKMADVSSHEEDCEDDDEMGDEEELAEIHHSIETILEGLLGGTLDDAPVDHLFPNSLHYLNIFAEYHIKLVEAIQNLSKALQKALHNLPAENGITPTSAHAALKGIISTLVDECQDLPLLQYSDRADVETSISPPLDYADMFSSYNSLIAIAVINKVVEESQLKFKVNYNSMQEIINLQQEVDDNSIHSLKNNEDEFTDVTTTGAHGFDLPVECVQIEEVEEITQEFTDSDEDKLSSISKYSNSMQSVDDVGLQKHSEMDILAGLDIANSSPTPFPEFGCDLIDNPENTDVDATCHITATTSWEDNWLFRKKKRLPLYSNLKYQLLTYCDEPPCMLIPQPGEATDVNVEEELSSELSETHSAGSLEFSTDSEAELPSKDSLQQKEILCREQSVTCLSEETQSKSAESLPPKPSPVTVVEASCNQQIEKCHVIESNSKCIEVQKAIDSSPDNSNFVSKSETSNKKVNASAVSENTIENPDVDAPKPPRPGTIAEREHKKWQNAVPLKNNPYSAENISKRSSFSKNILNESVSSFEEFERRLSVTPSDSESAKVNCGPKSIDTELYKRDYYVNQNYEDQRHLYPVKKSTKQVYSFANDGYDALSEEALNSFEEKVYVSSGKVFTLENHVRRLEREINDYSKDLVINTKGNSQATEVTSNFTTIKSESDKLKKNKPAMKVHSLTARSLSREFRDLAKLNLPKPMNRTIPVPSHCDDVTSERESLCSPESAPSSYSSQQPDNGHGYTSDESNTSNNSNPRPRRHISRSILERATYWERRAEQGLLSDASVSEEFPGVDI